MVMNPMVESVFQQKIQDGRGCNPRHIYFRPFIGATHVPPFITPKKAHPS